MLKFVIALLIPIQIVFSQEMDKFLKIDKTNSILFNQDLNDKKGLFPGIKNLYKGSILKLADTNRYYAWLLLKADSVLKDSIIWLDDNKARSLYESIYNVKKFNYNDSLFIYNDLCNRAQLNSIYNYRIGKKINYQGSDYEYKIMNFTNFTFDHYYTKNYNNFYEIIKEDDWIIYKNDSSLIENLSLSEIKRDKLIVNQDNYLKEIDIMSIKKLKYDSGNYGLLGGIFGFFGSIIIGIPLTQMFGLSSWNPNGGLPPVVTGMIISTVLGTLIGIQIGIDINNDVEIDLNYTDYYDKLYNLKKQTYFAIPDSSIH